LPEVGAETATGTSMAMITTCPNCATSFNVEPEILLKRNGRVRCGQCKQIFDGLMTLTTLEELQAATSAADDRATALPPAPEPEVFWPPLPEAPEVPIPPMPLEVVAAATPEYLVGAAAHEEEPHAVARTTVVAPPSAPIAADVVITAPMHDVFDAAPAKFSRGWAVAAVLAALVLAGQVVYRYRSELSAHFPVVKPALAQVCAWARCRVPPLQQPASLTIEASDLQVADKAQPHLVQLTATLRNRAAIELGYPAFDLVLTDSREHALARRVILPADYLPGPHAALAAIAANAEITLRVDMDLGGLPAAGFRLNLTSAPTY
jgi:predicted Zn finger-like uncharacterized protein